MLWNYMVRVYSPRAEGNWTFTVGETGEGQPEIVATPKGGTYLIFKTENSGFKTIHLSPDTKR